MRLARFIIGAATYINGRIQGCVQMAEDRDRGEMPLRIAMRRLP